MASTSPAARRSRPGPGRTEASTSGCTRRGMPAGSLPAGIGRGVERMREIMRARPAWPPGSRGGRHARRRGAVVVSEPRHDAEAGVAEQCGQLVGAIQAHAFLKPPTLIPQLDLLDNEVVGAVDAAAHQHIAALGLLDHLERAPDVLCVEIIEHEMTARRERRSDLTDDPAVLLFVQKVTE